MKPNTTRYAITNSDFIIPRFNTIIHGKHSIRHLGPTFWSKLSEDLRKSKTLTILINRIRIVDVGEVVGGSCKIASFVLI